MLVVEAPALVNMLVAVRPAVVVVGRPASCDYTGGEGGGLKSFATPFSRKKFQKPLDILADYGIMIMTEPERGGERLPIYITIYNNYSLVKGENFFEKNFKNLLTNLPVYGKITLSGGNTT